MSQQGGSARRVGERSYWQHIPDVFAAMGPPLRPAPSVVAQVRAAIDGRTRHVLLLGVTPELASLGERLVAVDRQPAMVERHWSGDDDHRRVLIGDWRSLPLADASIDSVIGDGCLSVLPSSERAGLLRELQRVLRPGGRLVLRLFCAPESIETPSDVHAAAMQGGDANFWAFRWRWMMAIAASHPGYDLPVHAAWQAFDAIVDRAALAQATGWQRALIDTMDRYRDSSDMYCFAPMASVLAGVPAGFDNVRLVATQGYELAERCPLLVAERGV